MSAGTFPTPTPYYIPKARYVRLECDLKDPAGELLYPGFWIEARQNLTNGERQDLVDAIHALDDQRQDATDATMDRAEALDAALAELRRKPDDAGDDWRPDGKAIRALQSDQRALLDQHAAALMAFDRQRRDLVTPYIRAWNLYEAGEAGEPTPVPPPAEGGAAVLEQVEPELSQWMIVSCLNAYRSGKALSASTTSSASPEPSSAPIAAVGPQIPPQPTRRSRKR